MQLHNKKAEMSVLGAILANNQAMNKVVGLLEPGDFYTPAHGKIYAAMLKMYGRDEHIDYLTLEHELTKDVGLDAIGGAGYLVGLANEAPSLNAAESYARVVRECAQARVVRATLEDGLHLIDTGHKPEEVTGIIHDVAERVSAASVAKEPNESESYALLEQVQAGDVMGFVGTGFDELDRYAPAPDEMLIIAAYPSTGKTALALELAENMAAAGRHVALFSVEMSARAIHWRRWAREARIDSQRLRRRGALSQDDWTRLAPAIERCRKRPLQVVDSISHVYRIAERCKRMKMAGELDVAIIDHLQLMTMPKAENRNLQIQDASGVLARMSKRLGVVVIALSQLSREGRLRDSGALDQDTDSVWMLSQDSKAAVTKLIINVVKNREGPTGVISLLYDKQTGKLSPDKPPF